MAIPYLEKFRNVTYEYETEHDTFLARGLQLNLMVDKINTIADFVNANVIEDGRDSVKFNTINEFTLDNGVDIDGVHIQDGEISLSYIGNPTGDVVISPGGNIITWRFTNPNGGVFYEWTGGARGHLFELNQNTGTPTAGTHLLHMEAVSPNVTLTHWEHGAATYEAVYSSVIGDVAGAPRWNLLVNGKMSWGAGSVATDVSLERSGANTLTITGNLTVTGTLSASLPWSSITATPTTLAGYGIADAYTQTNLQTSGQAQVHYNNLTNVPNMVNVATRDVLYSDADTWLDIVSLDADDVVLDIKIYLETVFNDTTTNILEIGNTTDTDYYIHAGSSIDITTGAGSWLQDGDFSWNPGGFGASPISGDFPDAPLSGAETLRVKYTDGVPAGAPQGKLIVYVWYAKF